MSDKKKIYDFCGKGKIVCIVTALILLVAVVGSFVLGVDVAIEFKGGTIITYSYTGDIDLNEIEKITADVVSSGARVSDGESLSTGEKNLTISFTSNDGLTADRQSEFSDAIEEKYPDNNFEIYDSNDVNPTTGKEFFLKCIVAVVFAAIIIILYIALRFKKIGGISAGVCAVLAIVHDLVAVYAAFILFGFEINSNFMAVILTILGYSVNDTIVIYDRIREDRLLMPKASMREVINAGCSQSLTRSIRTSITTIGTMIIITIVVLISGYDSLLSFSVPLIFGLISGTYSSLFITTTVWSKWLERKEKKTAKAKK